jgi:hypothetical protein
VTPLTRLAASSSRSRTRSNNCLFLHALISNSSDVIPAGKYIGERGGGEPKDDAEHFIRCPTCGAMFDMRDLGQALEHLGPLPHPSTVRR